MQAATMECKPIMVDREVYWNFIVKKVFPAFDAVWWAKMYVTIKIQHVNAQLYEYPKDPIIFRK